MTNPKLLYLREGDRLSLARAQILRFGVTAVPVLDDAHRPIAVVSLRDLQQADDEILASSPVHTVRASERIEAGARQLAKMDAHHLVVVDDEGGAVGMVSAIDFVRALSGEAPRTRPPSHSTEDVDMRMSTRLAVLFGTVLAISVGCGCTSLAIGGADRSALRSGTLVEACPLGVPWTRIEMHDAQDGIELIFSTTAQNVEELRRRVRDQARAYGPDRHRGAGHDGEHRGPRDHGLRLWTMGALRTSVEDTPSGAKLVVSPVDPGSRAELRERVARRVDHISRSGCPR